MAFFTYEPLCKVPERQLIIDTDIGPDCDDAGALAIAFTLQKKYRFHIAAVMNCTSNPYGDGAIDAIADYYGIGPIPIGRYPEEGFLCGENERCYNKYLATEMSTKYKTGTLKVSPAPALYRKILEGAEDNSIVLAAIGPLNNLSDLLSDAYDLVCRKIYAAVVMAGAFPKGREYNVVTDIVAAQNFFENFPRPILCCGYEVGADVLSGFDTQYNHSDNPVYQAYRLFSSENGQCLRPSWDPLSVLFAIEGAGDFFTLSQPGRVCVREDGTNEFVPESDGRAYYIRKKAENAVLANDINAIIRA